MKTNRKIKIILAGTLLLMAGTLSSCSSDEEVVSNYSSLSPAYVEGIYNNPATRSISNEKLTSFSMYCFDEWNEYTGEMLADNIIYSLNPDTKVWSGDKVYYMSDWDAMYGYGVSPNIGVATEPVFKQQEQSFVYSNPTEKGELIKVASKHYFTKEGTNNRLMLTFNDALYTLRFQAFSGFNNVDVEIKEITIHNIPNKAKFTFSPSVESWGTWTLTDDNQYITGTQTLPSAVPITTTDFADITTEPFVLFPIQPDEWDYWGGETFAQAKARNCLYIEVKMRIKEEKDSKTYYQWGYADDDPLGREPFESAFYPYEQYNCTADWRMTYNGYYFLFLDDNGVDKEGLKITPHPEDGGSTQFTVSSQIDFRTLLNQNNNTADEWEIETGKTVEL